MSLAIGVISSVVSGYLLYLLVAVLYKICLVCIAIHTINVLLLVNSSMRWRGRLRTVVINKKQ